MTQTRLNFKDMCAKFDVTPRTLRYYEELGLLTPAERSTGGFRRYDPSQVDRVTAIKRLQDLGLSLRQIQSTIQGNECSNGTCGREAVIGRIRHAIDTQADLVAERMRDLKRDLDDLAKAREKLEQCGGCEETLSLENCDPCQQDQAPLSAVIRALL